MEQDVLQTRRRDWTPWEFERACRNLAPPPAGARPPRRDRPGRGAAGRWPPDEDVRRRRAAEGARAGGRRGRLRHPRRREHADLRPAGRPVVDPPHPLPPRAGRRPRRRGLRLGDRQGRRLHGDVAAPAATNLVTPLADAKMDSVPIVAITGQVPTPVVGNDAFQEADITGITMPVTKHNFLVKDPAEIVETIREAFHIASTGRPGPVLVDLPKDVLLAETTYQWPERRQPARLQADDEGQPAPGRRGREADHAREAPGALRGRRRDQGRRAQGAVQARDRPGSCRSSRP